MHQFSELTVEKAAEILAARRIENRRAFSITKMAEGESGLNALWNSVKDQAGKVWNAAPNLETQHLQPAAAGQQSTFMAESGREALRNALMGGLAGAGAGGIASMFRRDKKRRTLSDILSGGLLGATMGGAGTLGLRATQQLTGPQPSEYVRDQEAALQAWAKNQAQKSLAMHSEGLHDPNAGFMDRVGHGVAGIGEAAGGLLDGRTSVKNLVDATTGAGGNVIGKIPDTGFGPGQAAGTVGGAMLGTNWPEMLQRPMAASRLKQMAETGVGRKAIADVFGGSADSVATDKSHTPGMPKPDLSANKGPTIEVSRRPWVPQAQGLVHNGLAPITHEVPLGPALKNIPETPTLGQRFSYSQMVPGATPESARKLKTLASQGRFGMGNVAKGISGLIGGVGGNIAGRFIDKQLGY